VRLVISTLSSAASSQPSFTAASNVRLAKSGPVVVTPQFAPDLFTRLLNALKDATPWRFSAIIQLLHYRLFRQLMYVNARFTHFTVKTYFWLDVM